MTEGEVLALIADKMSSTKTNLTRLAEGSGVDNGNLSRLLRGLRGERTSFNTISKLLQALDIPWSTLDKQQPKKRGEV